MAKPWIQGDLVGEPLGSFKNLSILKEQLELNLQNLAKSSPGVVTATYTVRNSSKTPVTTELLFVSFALNKGSIYLNGKPITYKFVKNQPVPKDWKIPKKQISDLHKTPQKIHGMKFQVTLPKGDHTIKVSYPVNDAEYHDSDKIYRERTVWYLLAPAKRWASFGTLHVKVTTPNKWKLTSNHKLVQSKNIWSGTFQGIPSNHLIVTVHKKQSWILQGRWISILATLLGILFTAGFLWNHAHTNKTMARTGMERVAPFLGHLLLAMALAVGLALGSFWVENNALDANQVSRTWAYSNAILRIMILLVSGAGTLLLGVTAYLIGLRVKKSKFQQA